MRAITHSVYRKVKEKRARDQTMHGAENGPTHRRLRWERKGNIKKSGELSKKKIGEHGKVRGAHGFASKNQGL